MFSFLGLNKDKKEESFVSKMSHDLRTPMSAVKWYAEMLLDGDGGELNEEQKKYITVIRDNNQKAIDMINSYKSAK